MKRRISFKAAIRTASAASIMIGALLSFATPATAQELPTCESVRSVAAEPFYVTKVSGLLDSVVHAHLLKELEAAEAEDADGFIIWMDSAGSTISSEQLVELMDALTNAPFDTGMWVGTNVGNRGRGVSRALGGSAQLAASVDAFALTPGATWGKTGELANPAQFTEKFASQTEFLKSDTFTAQEAEELGLSVGPLEVIADVKQFLASFDSYQTVECETDAGATVKKSISPTQLSGLSMTSQLFHTASSAELSYLFFMLGMSLLVFELFTAGVGVAGITGAGFLLLGAYGLGNLPTRPLAVAALVIAMFFIAIDIQTNMPSLYSAFGLGLLTVASVTLFRGITISWFTIVVVLGSAAIYIYSAMPAMVRSRFATPTIGREYLIGETATVHTELAPEGEVLINGAQWKAFTNRATPVPVGDQVTIVGIDRLVLEAAPLDGAARDYRDRA